MLISGKNSDLFVKIAGSVRWAAYNFNKQINKNKAYG